MIAWQRKGLLFRGHYTNGPTESRNNLIKILNRTGRGHSFEVLRFKLRHGQSNRLVLPVFTKLKRDGSIMKIMQGYEEGNFTYRELLNSYLAGTPLPEGIGLMHGMGIDDSAPVNEDNAVFMTPEEMYCW